GDRRRQPVDRVDIGLLHHLQELPRVRRQRLDVPALALRVDRVEGKARLPGPGEAGDADQPLPRKPDGDVLEVVLPGAVYDELVGSHGSAIVAGRTYVLKGVPPGRSATACDSSVLGLPPAAEHESAEGEAEPERADREAAERHGLSPRRQPLPPAERLLLLEGQTLAATPLPKRPACADTEVEII